MIGRITVVVIIPVIIPVRIGLPRVLRSAAGGVVLAARLPHKAEVCFGSELVNFVGDIAIEGGRIAAIGQVDAAADRIFDASGLVVAPGFIDVHTHYDAQIEWDPLLTPSSWNGVTTVLVGNCGFTLAPARPEDVDWLIGMLTRVEGMSREALNAGLSFAGGSFGDYWNRFRGRLGINVGAYVGHCAIRRYVMGDDASVREATAGEIEAMKALVREAMDQGAIGFSTSQLAMHVGEDGREVPAVDGDLPDVAAQHRGSRQLTERGDDRAGEVDAGKGVLQLLAGGAPGGGEQCTVDPPGAVAQHEEVNLAAGSPVVQPPLDGDYLSDMLANCANRRLRHIRVICASCGRQISSMPIISSPTERSDSNRSRARDNCSSTRARSVDTPGSNIQMPS